MFHILNSCGVWSVDCYSTFLTIFLIKSEKSMQNYKKSVDSALSMV